jgi:alkanesulfonate monooxygenase SsuD/methylene tetrahydromethanopterin reductase-like flavin-dependent oxidoreductase (luciferase family)
MHVGIASGFANVLGRDDAQFLKDELAQLVAADELGYQSIWITEHHFGDYSISPNPLTYLTYLAGRTKNALLGTQVIVVPWHDPVRIAENIAILDHVSGGRAVIGFGRGLSRKEYEGFRIDQGEARQRFDEAVEMVMAALETGYLEYDGQHFQQPRRELRPRPVRSLKGRAFCAAGSPSSMVSAAKLGLGRLYLGQPMVAGHKNDESTLAKLLQEGQADVWLDTWLENHPGETPPAPMLSNIVYIDESSDRAHEMAATYAANTMRAAIENYELTSEHLGTTKGYEAYASLRMTPEQAEQSIAEAHRSTIVGNPREVLAQLETSCRQRNPQAVFPHVYHGGMAHEECMHSMMLFAKECLPEIKIWPSPETTFEPA